MNNELSSHDYREVLDELFRRLREPAPVRLQLVTADGKEREKGRLCGVVTTVLADRLRDDLLEQS